MPLNYQTGLMSSAWKYWLRRNATAIGGHRVRQLFQPADADRAAMVVSVVAGVVLMVAGFALSWFSPKGQLGDGSIIASRDSSQLYVRVGNALDPALNLASARLIVGTNEAPQYVPGEEIRKYPSGPYVGIPGAPSDLTVSTPETTTWSLCDTVASPGSQVVPRVTVLDGPLNLSDQAHTVSGRSAILGLHDGTTWLIMNGHRTQVDLSDERVALALGITGEVSPTPLSQAVFDAIPATAALSVPKISEEGRRARYSPAGENLVVGSVVAEQDARGRELFAVLSDGVEEVNPVVAQVLRNADSHGQTAPETIPSDVLSQLPQSTTLHVDQFPSQPVQVVDKAAEPVTCLRWSRNHRDPAALLSVVSGRRLPLTDDQAQRIRPFVQASAGMSVADEGYVGVDAANFVRVVGTDPADSGTESQWWITPAGVRFGVPTDENSVDALGVGTSTTWAPWFIVRWLPAGPNLSKAAAMTTHDTLPTDDTPGVLAGSSTSGGS
ncbi:type VII secretion protein EccB [Tsukamurella sp. 8F]|uniref:type VII secretion protein EccB n=1 Tax=unclassified Tsukamurella TaxID=2633480 RepID=UPI0023B9A45B|nr:MULTISPECIES: type VII secretion protein EccB [unclassified Tsukamurella]MDF0531148.1 type VII secretion protein EccB [Tsukamurella sp. 8J]MDF0588394.1 type VII secretion protein EccB [Tsukamurella sp. 8F]